MCQLMSKTFLTFDLTAFLELATGLVPRTAFVSFSGACFLTGKGLTGKLGRALSKAAITTVLEPGCNTIQNKQNSKKY